LLLIHNKHETNTLLIHKKHYTIICPW